MNSFFSKLFRKKVQTKQEKKPNIVRTPECDAIIDLNKEIQSLCEKNHYIPKSQYIGLFPKYQKTVSYFKVLETSGMLQSFCDRSQMDMDLIQETMASFNSLEEVIDKANEAYIEETLQSEKAYLDNILCSVDPIIQLDNDQRKVILTDEDYCLVIAGAGAGKTTTVAAKVKYLVEKKNVNPREILVISFTNKAVGELREKINRDLEIDCPIATFHSTGNAILHIHNPEQLNIVDNSKLYFLLQDYFKSTIFTNESLMKNLILFFASYFDAPYEDNDREEFFYQVTNTSYTTMRSDFDEYQKDIVDAKTKKHVTIQNEVVRSHQEVEIANFLYLNGLDYEYEPIYPYNIRFARKPYTPDFIVRQGENIAYIEHFGITEDGKNDRFTEDELNRYKKSVNNKVVLHRQHGTKLIYTFSAYKDRKSITVHLEEKLKSQGFLLNPRTDKEVIQKIVSSEKSKYIRRLLNLICRFITNFKTNGYTADEFKRMYDSTTNVRSRLFLKICEECYLEYERYLKENNAVDFEDMINESARVLREVKEMKQRLNFKYIIVDEYQDISRQRFDLTTALSEVTDAKIIAVGDDWQSIYAFSGSDISLFTKFKEKMGYAKLLKIVRTYRNSQEVIDIAGNFIQKNPTQIQKTLKSPKNIIDPVIIYTYDTASKKQNQDRRTGILYATAKAVEIAIEQIIEYGNAEGKKDIGTILLLGRYAFDGEHLERSGLFEYQKHKSQLKSVKYPKLDITFMTVHTSKGLGYDNVIVVNGKNETYGFPSKIQDDPVLSFVTKGDNSIDYAEERRLFYVAMTRTKNRVYFIAPEQNPSEFLLEIKQDYKNVVLKGHWNEEEIKQNMTKKVCPICGYPMQLRYKNAYGLRLYLCMNEPELCGFMTNDIKAGKLAITKCEKCRDGYLIVKSAKKSGFFLGCTNYTADKKGCNHTINSMDYYAMMNFAPEVLPSVGDTKRSMAQKVVKQMSTADRKNENREVGQKEEGRLSAYPIREKLNEKQENQSVEYKGFDLYDVVVCLLQCLEHISEKKFYGRTVLVATVRGGNRKQIREGKLYNVPEYGRYSEMSRDDMWAIVQWLIENHYMLLTKEYYKKLHLTYEGIHFKATLTLKELNRLKEYLEDPNREMFVEEGDENR